MRTATSACPEGMQIFSGGARWAPPVGVADEVMIAQVNVDPRGSTVEVTGGHDLDEDRTLFAQAHCLG